MKNLFSLVFALCTASAAHAAPQSYPLQCRGGGGTLGYDSSTKTAQLYFSKAPGRAGLGLAAGQCSWLDRAIGTNEPPCLGQSGVNTQVYLFPSNLTGSYFASSQAAWLETMRSSANYTTFQAYNPGNGGCFVVTRVQ